MTRATLAQVALWSAAVAVAVLGWQPLFRALDAIRFGGGL